MNEEELELFWEELRTDSFAAIRTVIDRLEKKLKVYPAKEAFEYLKPIRYLICEAEMQLDDEKSNRIDNADDILGQVSGS